MPNKKNVQITVSRPTSVREVSDEKSVAVVVQPSSRRRRSRRRRSRGRQRGNRVVSAMGPLSSSYVRSLADPFENSGPKLGWGCLQPTAKTTAYLRGSVTANADGTLVLAAVPTCKGLLQVNAAGAAVATWTASDATSLAAIAQNFSAGRPISIGIRAYPDIAATSVPGQCLVGHLSTQSLSTLQSCTPNDFAAFPTSHVYRGYEGGSSTGRPTDISSFEFYPATVSSAAGFGSAVVIPYSIPYVAFTGLPASAVVFYEVALNLECLFQTAHGVSSMNNLDNDSGPTLSNEWPTLEKMWTYVKDILPTPGQPSEKAATVWDTLNKPLMRGAARGALRGYRQANRDVRPYMNSLMDAADAFLA